MPELARPSGGSTDPPPPPAARSTSRSDDIRLELVTACSSWRRGRPSPPRATRGRGGLARTRAWLGRWEHAVAAAAERITARRSRVRQAAEESRFPRRRLQAGPPLPADTRAIAARLGGGGAPFVAALDRAGTGGAGTPGRHAGRAPPARRPGGPRSLPRPGDWRRRGSRWSEAAEREQLRWQADVRRVHAWRLARWPLWLITAVGWAPRSISAWWSAAMYRCRRSTRRVRRLLVELGCEPARRGHRSGGPGPHRPACCRTRASTRWGGCSLRRNVPTSATRPDPTGHAGARIAAKEAVYKAMQSLPGRTGDRLARHRGHP